MSSDETITREELATALDRELDSCYVGGKELAVNVFEYARAHREPEPEAPQPEGVYCRVQIKGYQEYTGYLTEGTFCGQPYAFLRDAGGREIAKFPPDSVHLITPPEEELPGRWERPALTAAGDDEEDSF